MQLKIRVPPVQTSHEKLQNKHCSRKCTQQTTTTQNKSNTMLKLDQKHHQQIRTRTAICILARGRKTIPEQCEYSDANKLFNPYQRHKQIELEATRASAVRYTNCNKSQPQSLLRMEQRNNTTC